MKSFFTPWFSALIAACFGCGYSRVINIPKPKPYPSPSSSQLVVGIAQADLTLPPGYPMAGYSINGRISRGYWLRPKATALFMRDTAGTPFLFVTTDLWAITEAQKMAVLEELGKDSATWFIGESELLLCATHAHHSQGAIELDKAFNSTSIGFGIDVEAFAFTIAQIVSAIKKAVSVAEPASVSYSVETVSGIAKNRSKEAYLQNSPIERAEYITSKTGVAKNKFYRSKEEIASFVDERLTVITVKNLAGKITGILASYPMHPTATGDATEVYSADVFGLASIKVSQEVSDKQNIPNKPVVAFYNGAEGDVAPIYKFHYRQDAVCIANELSAAIVGATTSVNQTSLNGKIIHRTTTIDIASNSTTLDDLDIDCYKEKPALARTAASPVVGATVFAGASDGRTSLSSFGISDGIKSDEWDDAQGHKLPAIQFLSDKVFGQVLPKPIRFLAKKLVKIKPRSKLRISIHKIGNVYFTGLPGEFTTMLGRRIRKMIATKLNIPDSSISLIGLADAYISYVTTPCEYEKQFYEGASTFFGISTGPVFIKEYKNLLDMDADKMEERRGKKFVFKGGKKVTFGPQHLGELQTWNAEEGLRNLLISADGFTVVSKEIPPIELPLPRPPELTSNEIIAYSFYDAVNTIKDGNFYPIIMLRREDGKMFVLPEHILTIDQYESKKSLWTVRILDTSSLVDGKLYQIVVIPRSGISPPPSCFFSVVAPTK